MNKYLTSNVKCIGLKKHLFNNQINRIHNIGNEKLIFTSPVSFQDNQNVYLLNEQGHIKWQIQKTNLFLSIGDDYFIELIKYGVGWLQILHSSGCAFTVDLGTGRLYG